LYLDVLGLSRKGSFTVMPFVSAIINSKPVTPVSNYFNNVTSCNMTEKCKQILVTIQEHKCIRNQLTHVSFNDNYEINQQCDVVNEKTLLTN